MASLPNLLTLIRLPLAGMVWLRPADLTWLLAMVALAAATDVVDGRIARALRRDLAPERRELDQAIGAWLDPLCDKAFAVSMVAAVAFGFEIPLVVVVLVLTRELLIAPMMAAYHLIPAVRETLEIDFSADWLGKLTTVLQFITVAAALLLPAAAIPLAIAAAITGAAAAAHYVRRGIAVARDARRNPVGHAKR